MVAMVPKASPEHFNKGSDVTNELHLSDDELSAF
jgi:hypothetical protein